MSSPQTQTEGRIQELIDRPKLGLWRLAGPMIVGMSVHTLYLIGDFAFIGQVGEEALAGVTLVGPLYFVIFAVLNGVGIAVTALVAQALGRDDREEASRVASGSIGVSLLVGLVFAVAGISTGPELLRLLGARGALHSAAWEYFQIIAATMPVFFLSGALRSILTGEGDAKTPTLVMVISTALNLGLDAVFILGLGMGVRGAALATAAAVSFSALSLAWVILVRRSSLVRIKARSLGFQRALFDGLWHIGLPAALGQLIMAIGGAATNRLLTSFGSHALAGYGAASRVDMIVAIPVFGIAGAAVTLVGVFAGAGRQDLVRRTALYAYRWAIGLAVLAGLGAWLGSVPIMRIFVTNDLAVAVGQTYLLFGLAMYPMMAFGVTTGRLLQGLGLGLPALVITTLRVLAIAVPSSYVAVYVFDAPIEAIWASLVAGGLASSLLAIFWVRRLLWLRDPTVFASSRVSPSTGALPTAAGVLPPPVEPVPEVAPQARAKR
ncbi:MAG: MATE family efflux transporter [Polyangia bacterium]|nr:MATE family efflux transporter [Polyangia bacterium]